MHDSKVEVLVAAVNKDAIELYNKMKIATNAVIANQGDTYCYLEKMICDRRVRVIETAGQGVGKNRNLALMCAEGEYLLFSDEDIVYRDGYEKMVIDAFERHPDADMLIFDINFLGEVREEKIEVEKRIFVFNAMKYGTPRFVIKRDSLRKVNIWFSLLYGGGAPHACGEDSLYLREILRKKLKVYTVPAIIADLKQEESTWFHGYNDKYFKDKGMLIANMFPFFCHFLIFIFSERFAKKTNEYTFLDIYRLMKAGIRYYKNRK